MCKSWTAEIDKIPLTLEDICKTAVSQGLFYQESHIKLDLLRSVYIRTLQAEHPCGCIFVTDATISQLRTDASSIIIGAALDQQRSDRVWVPLGFFSRELLESERL